VSVDHMGRLALENISSGRRVGAWSSSRSLHSGICEPGPEDLGRHDGEFADNRRGDAQAMETGEPRSHSIEEMLPLSEAQAKVLSVFRDGPTKPKWIAPITRRWLMTRGLIIASSLGKGKHDFNITERGREVLVLDEAYKRATQKGRTR